MPIWGSECSSVNTHSARWGLGSILSVAKQLEICSVFVNNTLLRLEKDLFSKNSCINDLLCYRGDKKVSIQSHESASWSSTRVCIWLCMCVWLCGRVVVLCVCLCPRGCECAYVVVCVVLCVCLCVWFCVSVWLCVCMSGCVIGCVC